MGRGGEASRPDPLPAPFLLTPRVRLATFGGMTARALAVFVLFSGILAGAAHAAGSSEPYDVLCDTVAGTAYCHPGHPGHPSGKRLTYPELRARVNTFGAGRMAVLLVSGETRSARRFAALDTSLRIGADIIPLRDIRFVYLRSSWPEWSTVASLATGGALLFGGFGMVIDGVQWMAGGDADLVSTWRGALVGAALFGGLGLWLARDEARILVQPGAAAETVGIPPMYEHLARPVASGTPSASQSVTAKSAR